MGRYKALRWERNRISYHLSYRCWPKEPMVISVFLSVSFDFDLATFNLTLLTIPYWSSSILMIRAMGQWFRAWSFRTRRTSPTWRFLDIPFHLTLDCNVTRFMICYTRLHLSQQYKSDFLKCAVGTITTFDFMVNILLGEKCPNTELFLVRIFPHADWIQRDTKYLFVFSPNAGK